jgi:hypothetical protein
MASVAVFKTTVKPSGKVKPCVTAYETTASMSVRATSWPPSRRPASMASLRAVTSGAEAAALVITAETVIWDVTTVGGGVANM